jgi:hypothetical protein
VVRFWLLHVSSCFLMPQVCQIREEKNSL